MPTRPLSNRLHLFSKPLLSGDDFRLCLLGDSKTSEAATNASLNYAIARTWKVPTWAGIFTRGVYGQIDLLASGTDSNSTTSVYTQRDPGATFGNGSTGCFPNTAREWRFSGNPGAGTRYGFSDLTSGYRTLTISSNTTGSTTCTITFASSHRLHSGQTVNISGASANLNGNWRILYSSVTTITVTTNSAVAASSGGTVTVPSDWAVSDWFSGQHMMGRVIAWSSTTAGMVDSMSLLGRRNGSVLVPSTEMNCTLTDGVSVHDHQFSNASGFAGIEIETRGANDETNKYMAVCNYGLIRHDGSGNRINGFVLSHIAQGGWTSRHALNALGSGTDQITVPQANTLAVLNAFYKPQYWLVDLGQNTTAGEAAELLAGTYATFKANMAAIIGQIRVLHAAMGLSGLPVILLCNPYSATSSDTTTASNARGNAMYELSCEYENVAFLDVYALMPIDQLAASSGLSHWTADGTHPTPEGAVLWGSVIWSALKSNYDTITNRRAARL